MSQILDILIKDIKNVQIIGDQKRVIKGIALDSRKVKSDTLFAALKGEKVDGYDYVGAAISAGATVILSDRSPSEDLSSEVTWLVSADVRGDLGVLASRFYNSPSEKMKIVGVTGTNGKTTVASLLYGLFKELGYRVGLVSTIEVSINERRVDASLTTPDVVSLHSIFADMHSSGCDYVFMEVSSHAVVQQRIAGVCFAAGVFTNISHDHLDYHGTFSEYISAKRGFFDSLSDVAYAITNLDDRNGLVMTQSTDAQVLRYSLRDLIEYKGRVLTSDGYGMHLEINDMQFMSRLVGDFNAYNLLAVYAVADVFGVAGELEVLEAMSKLEAVSGRMELVAMSPRVIVDYAHTPDALENVLHTLRGANRSGRIITVVGCGGDRDVAKRPVMAAVSARMSDQVVFTSDNPRSEDPRDIMDDMTEGVSEELQRRVIEIVDRKMAIKTALALANKNDTVLIAGKGHEQYQEINGERSFFSDQQIVKDILSESI